MKAPATLPWWRAGESLLAATVDRVTAADLGGPSLLEGWSRRTLVAHLAGNADALVNLMTWATTGVETPMYASPQARADGIEQIAALSDDLLRARYADSTARLATAIDTAPAGAWTTRVRTAQGREVPAAQVPWMRCREAWIHAVDLDAGAGFDDVPGDVLIALVDDVVRTWTQRDELPDVTLRVGDRVWGSGRVEIRGSLADVAATLTGRTVAVDTHVALETQVALDRQGVALPRWL